MVPLMSDHALIWSSALTLSRFTRTELAKASAAPFYKVRAFVRKLQEAGIIRSTGIGHRNTIIYEVVRRDAFETSPPAGFDRSETAVGNMWTAMRGLTTFTAVDVAASAATDRTAIPVDLAASYCRMLARIGYLRAVRKAIPNVRPAVYRLIRNTGPRPPRERRVTGVYDHNLGEFIQFPAPVSA